MHVNQLDLSHAAEERDVSPVFSDLFITNTLSSSCQRKIREEAEGRQLFHRFLLTRPFHPNRLQEKMERPAAPFLFLRDKKRGVV